MVKVAYDVIIVGGGPVGLGLAVELGQVGVRALVLERNLGPSPIPKGQNLTQRTLEHFHFWGMEDALRAAQPIPVSYGVGGITAYGSLLGGLHYDWLQRDLVGAFYFTANARLPQYETERVLRERIAALPCVTLVSGAQVTAIRQDAQGVEVDAKTGVPEGPASFSASYAVGCDGSHSLVRKCCGISQTQDDRSRLMALVLFSSEELHERLKAFPGKSYFNVLNPALQGYWQFFGRVDLEGNFFFHAPVPADARKPGFDFTVLLQEAIGAACVLEVRHAGFWDLRFAIADTYRNQRVFLAGDAAHSHPPYGGYGINTGLEDARNLGWKLAARLAGWGTEALLDSYDLERRPVFESTARDFIAASIERDRAFLESCSPDRDAAAFHQAWQARAAASRSEVEQFEPNYEGSPVMADGAGKGPSALGHHAHKARAGHHLSPAALASGRNIYTHLGPHFTLLTRDPAAAADWHAAARSLGVPLEIVIGHVEAYEAEHILIRPDQFVAWSGNGDSAPLATLGRAVGAVVAGSGRSPIQSGEGTGAE